MRLLPPSTAFYRLLPPDLSPLPAPRVQSIATENRDTGTYGFLAPPTEIVPAGEEYLAAVLALVQHVLCLPLATNACTLSAEQQQSAGCACQYTWGGAPAHCEDMPTGVRLTCH